MIGYILNSVLEELNIIYDFHFVRMVFDYLVIPLCVGIAVSTDRSLVLIIVFWIFVTGYGWSKWLGDVMISENSPGQGKDSQKFGAQMHSSEDKPHEKARVRTRRWNVEENSRSVSALSLHDLFLFVQLTMLSQLLYCFFYRRLLRKCSSE